MSKCEHVYSVIVYFSSPDTLLSSVYLTKNQFVRSISFPMKDRER